MTNLMEAIPPTPIAEKDPWAEWDRFTEQTSASGFMQSSWWAECRVEMGYRHFGAVIKQYGIVIGGAIVQKYSFEDGYCFYYIQDGPILPKNHQLATAAYDMIISEIDIHRRIEKEIVTHLRIEPRWNEIPEFVRGFQAMPAFADPYTEPRDTLCIDLRVSEEEILANMKAKGRYNIRLAQRHGVTICEDASVKGLRDFISIYTETTERQDLSAKPDSYFINIVAALTTLGKGSIFFAEYKGQRIAAAIVVYFGHRATYFFGGSVARHRHVMAPYALHFEIMKFVRNLGCQWYDFWGVAPTNSDNHPWERISEFKRKFGGQEVNLVPTLDFVYDHAAYQYYIKEVCDLELIDRC